MRWSSGTPDLADLTATAADLMDAEVCALDALNDGFAGFGPDGAPAGSAAVGHELLRVVSERPRTREATRHTLEGTTVMTASLEHGPGRLGVVWTTKPHGWSETDGAVLERFAQAASIAIQQQQRKTAAWSPGAASTLVALVAGDSTRPSGLGPYVPPT